MDTTKLQSWLISVIKGIVSYPEEVEMEKIEDGMGILFSVSVHQDDRGKVIGKEGTIANAIRVILRSAGRLLDVKVSMKITVPGSNFKPKE